MKRVQAGTTYPGIKYIAIKYSGLLLLPVIILMVNSCSASGDKKGEGPGTTDAAGTEVVRVMKLDYTEISRKITYPANLRAFREVYLAPASPGRIDRIHVESGNAAGQGQLLVEMDRTQLNQALLQLSSIETDYRRIDTLRKAGSVSQQQYDQIRTQYDLARTNVQFLSENTRLIAPFSGRVSGRYFENGEMFSGAPNTPVGKAAILSLVQTGTLRATVNVSEKYYPNITAGMPVMVSSDVYPGEAVEGTVTLINPVIEPATRTFSIEFTLPNPDETLRPGMFARATLELEKVEVFVVPALAVLKLQGSNERFVFLEKNGRARRVVVEMGDRFDDLVEIISDEIGVGDNLVVAGQARLLDGVDVTVR